MTASEPRPADGHAGDNAEHLSYGYIWKHLYAKHRALPGGGPLLSILPPNEYRDYWTVSDSWHHYGMFRSAQQARGALRRAGFVSHRLASEKTTYWHTY